MPFCGAASTLETGLLGATPWSFESVATLGARVCSTAIRSLRCFPSKVPTLSAVISSSLPLSASTHRMGDAMKKVSASPADSMLKCCLISGSKFGIFPYSKSRFPPYLFGISSTLMKVERVGKTSCWARMNILEVVMGSNHFLIQPQTTGKNEGAPTI